MKFNQAKFAKMCRTVTQTELAERLDLNRQTVSARIQKLQNIKVTDFLAICEVIEEEPESFFDETEQLP